MFFKPKRTSAAQVVNVHDELLNGRPQGGRLRGQEALVLVGAGDEQPRHAANVDLQSEEFFLVWTTLRTLFLSCQVPYLSDSD